MQEIFPLRLYRFLYANRLGLMAGQASMSALALWVLPPLPGLILAMLALLPAVGLIGLVFGQVYLARVRFKALGPLSPFYLLFGAASGATALLAVVMQPLVLTSHVLSFDAALLIGLGSMYLTLFVIDKVFAKAFTQAWADSYTGA